MSINPALMPYPGQQQGPVLYAQEVLALTRDSIDFEVDNLAFGKWKARGILTLTNLRLVFIAKQADQSAGIAAYEIPLAYIRQAKFSQPIFFCNNLAGEVWSVSSSGTPNEAAPPHKWACYFKEGGVGTFLPLYFRFQEAAVQAYQQQIGRSVRPQNQSSSDVQAVATAFVDPGDPSRLVLTQPGDADRIPSDSMYAVNYGEDEVYKDMTPDT